MKIILASNSPTRKKLLAQAGFAFEVDPSNYEEDMSLPLLPDELAKHISLGKAEAVASKYRQGVVIGADTFVVYEDKILGKPRTPDKAREMLRMLSGKQHIVVTGFTIIDTEHNKTISRAVETKVFFNDLTDKEIDDYVATGEPLTKAGSYGILEGGGKFVKEIEGSRSNIAGLPMEELKEILKEFS